MKPLTKTVVNRKGGIAAQLVIRGRRETELPPAPQPSPITWTQTVDAEKQEVRIAVKYDRNAAHRTYMKEYMRKRRAADKLRKAEK